MRDDPTPNLQTVDVPGLLHRMEDLSREVVKIHTTTGALTKQQCRDAITLATTFLAAYPHVEEKRPAMTIDEMRHLIEDLEKGQ